MNITNYDDEMVEIRDEYPFVETQSPPTGDGAKNTPFATVTCPKDHILAVHEGTEIAPELYGEDGEKLDKDTTLIVQKADRMGNQIGSAMVYDGHLGDFKYNGMRTEPDKFARRTTKSVVLDEQESLLVFALVPDGSAPVDEFASNLTIGNSTATSGTPIELKRKDDLSSAHKDAVQQNSSAGE